MELQDKIVLITGATDGLGLRVAERLAGSGATLLLHGRNAGRGTALVKAIHAKGGRAAFHPADFASLADVRALAEAVARCHDRLDVLVNNAGIGTGGRGAVREVSRDGHELRFAVNHLAGFLLTRLLLPLLVRAPAARIVNVASAGQQAIDFGDVMLLSGYSGSRAYGQSKLAQIMTTFDLAQELAATDTTANCLHPASYMDTSMLRRDGIAPWSRVDEGADALLQLIGSPAIASRSGLYFDGKRPARAHAQAYDDEARLRLRRLSFALAGLPVADAASSQA